MKKQLLNVGIIQMFDVIEIVRVQAGQLANVRAAVDLPATAERHDGFQVVLIDAGFEFGVHAVVGGWPADLVGDDVDGSAGFIFDVVICMDLADGEWALFLRDAVHQFHLINDDTFLAKKSVW